MLFRSELGFLAYGTKEEQIFLGREITRHRDYSEETSRRIDAVVKQIILDANERVTQLLTEHRAALNAIAEALLDKETIVLDDMIRIVHEVEHPGEPKPNLRSSHKHITLRGGGIIFLFGVWLWGAFFGINYPWLLASVTLIAIISFFDDINSVPKC